MTALYTAGTLEAGRRADKIGECLGDGATAPMRRRNTPTQSYISIKDTLDYCQGHFD